jgi:energy-coupling factor transporter transmembrane protein EcfT
MTRWMAWFNLRRGPRERCPALVENSPLRSLDPRAKLVLSLAASLLVMLPLERLAFFLIFYTLLIAWVHLLPAAARQVWRLRWMLLFLFLMDGWLVGLNLAILVSLRLILLAGSFSLLFATTSFGEFRLALEHLGIPYRIAFSLGLAFQSISLLEEEWQAIREAQQARGIQWVGGGLRETIRQFGSWIALTVPAVILATRRAWAVTESAYARGFDSPHRRPYRRLGMRPVDWLVIAAALIVPGLFYIVW